MPHYSNQIEWTLGIGDPSIMGWVTVIAYFWCALKAFQVVKSSDLIFESLALRQTRLWLAITIAMALLGINKQLDLQSLFTATARWLAIEQGWYADRRSLQVMFIALIGFLGLSGVLFLFVFYKQVLRFHLLGIMGMGVLVIFVFARATSFHQMDHIIGMRVLGLKLNWVLELTGIAMIFVNARKLLRQRRPLVDLSSPPPTTSPGISDEHSD